MSGWWHSLVQIRRADGLKGSGIFISETEVLTAAHVVSRDGQALPALELLIDLRYRQVLAPVQKIALLPVWQSQQALASELAIVCVAAQPGLGVPIELDVPPLEGSALLEGVGFKADNDEVKRDGGSVRCRPTSAGERLLFSSDFSPVPGMSGGPLYTPLAEGVRVVGILTRLAPSGFLGLPIVAELLAQLRS